MYKMGATLSQAQAAGASVSTENDDSFSTHPKKSKRIDAIEKGYNKAKGQQLVANVDSKPSAEAFFEDGLQSWQNKSFQKAIDSWSAAIDLKPNYVLAYVNRGATKGELGDEQGAMSDFIKANQIAPFDGTPHFYIGMANARKGFESSKDLKL